MKLKEVEFQVRCSIVAHMSQIHFQTQDPTLEYVEKSDMSNAKILAIQCSLGHQVRACRYRHRRPMTKIELSAF